MMALITSGCGFGGPCTNMMALIASDHGVHLQAEKEFAAHERRKVLEGEARARKAHQCQILERALGKAKLEAVRRCLSLAFHCNFAWQLPGNASCSTTIIS